MSIVLGALCLLAAGAWLSYLYPKAQVWLLRALGVVAGLTALAVAAWFAVVVYREISYAISYNQFLRYEERSNRSGRVGKELIRTTNSTMLDGTSREFTADLASILGEERRPWQTGEQPRPGDRGGWIRLIITNEQGQALHMLLQDEYASGDWRFRLLSYRKIAQPTD